jgi:hypothetical protein
VGRTRFVPFLRSSRYQVNLGKIPGTRNTSQRRVIGYSEAFVSIESVESAESINPANSGNPTANLHTKQRGELAELAFMFKAVSMGYGVAKPWGDSERYDIILNAGRVPWRVQIKSTFADRCCHINASGRSGIRYTADEIDFLVVYLGFRDLWYIFPISAVRQRCVHVNPDARKRLRNEEYREAWELFGEPARVIPPPAIV